MKKITSKRLLSVLLCLALALAMLPMAVFANGDTYVVAGFSSLCGSNWSATDAANAMTLQGDVYVKTYTNVAAGTYQFKVVKNGSEWIGKDGNNVEFAVETTCDVTITFNPADYSITVTGAGVIKATLNVTAMYAVGNGSDVWLNGANWDTSAAANKMTQIGDAKWTITYTNVPAGNNYQFKFAANGTWDHSWGGAYTASGEVSEAWYNAQTNITLSLTETSNVTLVIDLSEYDHETKLGATFTVTVAPVVAEPTPVTLTLVTDVDTTAYDEVGFRVTYNGQSVDLLDTTVYENVTGFGAGNPYLAAAKIVGIPEGTEIQVAPLFVVDGVATAGTATTVVASNTAVEV